MRLLNLFLKGLSPAYSVQWFKTNKNKTKRRESETVFRSKCRRKTKSKEFIVEALYLGLEDLKQGQFGETDRQTDRQTDREKRPTPFIK